MKRKSLNKNVSLILIGLFFLPMMIPSSFENIWINIGDNSFHNKSNFTTDYYEKHRLPEDYPEKSIRRESPTVAISQTSLGVTPLKSMTHNSTATSSSWPMYCHDIKHTGRSIYNTSENPMTEKWRYSIYGYSSHCAPVLDYEGNIYVANSHIYSLYPNGTLRWEFEYGSPVEGCPAIDEQRGVLYYGIEWDSPNYVYALYLLNGSTKWKYLTGNHVTSSPVIDTEGVIYFGDWNGNIHAVFPNGTRKWMFNTGDVITSSPAIGNDGSIYIGSHDDYVYALYSNGTLKWRFQTGSWVHASPTIGQDGTVYIGSDDNYLYALNPNNGAMIWRCGIGGTWCSPTLGPDGILYLGVWEMKFYAIWPNGTIKWIYDAPGRIWSGASAALSNDGILYFGTTWIDGGTGAFLALNASDGHQLFIDNYGGYETSPSIDRDGTIYAVSTDIDSFYGILHVFGIGELKKIEITQPKRNHTYLLNKDIGTLLLNRTIIIGFTKVLVTAWSENDVDHVDFYAGYWSAEQYLLELKYSDTDPPFEWVLNEYLGNNHYPRLPFDKCRIQVIAYYEGGCTWVDKVDKFWYFHLRYN